MGLLRELKHKFCYRNSLLTAVFLSAAICASGCGQEETDQRTYGHDGYMGYSNSNPNLLNRHSNLSYQHDASLIEQSLAPLDGIEKTRISIVGSRIEVVLTVNGKLNESEVAVLKSKAQNVVQHNMPSYEVHVSVKQ